MESELNKKQSHKMTIFACLLSLVSIVLLVFGFIAVSSNKVVMLQSLSNLSKKLDKLVENNENLLNRIDSSSDIGIKSNITFSSDIYNGVLKLNYLDNKKDNKSMMNLDLEMANQKLLGADLALANNNIYASIDDITDKYYYQSFDYVSLFYGLSSKNYDKVMDILKETLNEQVENKSIKSTKLNIDYNGKSKKVTKLTYTIDSKVVNNFVTKFLNSVKKDKDLFNHISTITKLSSADLEKAIDGLITNLANTKLDSINYNVYYYGFNKIIKYELEAVNKTFKIEYSLGNTNTINITTNKGNMNLEYSKNKEKTVFNGTVTSATKKEFYGDINKGTITFVLKGEAYDSKVVLATTKVEKDNVYRYNNKITFSNVLGEQEKTLLSLDIDSEYYFDKKVDVSLEESVNFSEMSELDKAMIYLKVQNHPLYQMYQSLGFSL